MVLLSPALGRSQQAATIIRAVIALGRGLNVPVAAEGVETAEQLKFLASEHCNEIQGYLISRPMPASEVFRFLGLEPAEAASRAEARPSPRIDRGAMNEAAPFLRASRARLSSGARGGEGELFLG